MKKLTITTICVVLLIFGIIQAINSVFSFYSIKKHADIYLNSISTVKTEYYDRECFKEELISLLEKFAYFLKSFDFLYYFAIIYSIILIAIAILLFKFENKARIALLWYSAIALIYYPFIIILREINRANVVSFYGKINAKMQQYAHNEVTTFSNIIDNWHQYRLERFVANICIVSALTIFYLFIIYFFSKRDIKILFKD